MDEHQNSHFDRILCQADLEGHLICPCCSGEKYKDCCQPFHEELTHPPTAIALMRSRYSAYALGKADYIIKTTHPKSPYYERDKKAWEKQILHFCRTTEFLGLEIVDFSETHVHFIAKLKQVERAKFPLEENSLFERIHGIWYYVKPEQA